MAMLVYRSVIYLIKINHSWIGKRKKKHEIMDPISRQMVHNNYFTSLDWTLKKAGKSHFPETKTLPEIGGKSGPKVGRPGEIIIPSKTPSSRSTQGTFKASEFPYVFVVFTKKLELGLGIPYSFKPYVSLKCIRSYC